MDSLKHQVGESIDYGEIYVNDAEKKVQIVLGDADPTELFSKVQKAAEKEYPNYKIDVGSEDYEWDVKAPGWHKVKVSALETECQTPDAVYDTEITPKDVKVDVKLPHELDLDEGQAELLEKNLHNVVELVLAPHFKDANILDPIQPYLDPAVWIAPNTATPQLKPKLNDWIHKTIYGALERHGYEGPNRWLKLVLTGSLTTYQYSAHSDCDISLFVSGLPEWSRGEMIGVMVKEFDGILLPGTAHDIQAFVVSKTLTVHDLYKPGLRSAYDLETRKWIVPPDHSMSHDVERERHADYTYALEVCDKMNTLLKFEPEKAVQYYGVIHRRRQRDQTSGKGDFSASNLAYKMIMNRGYGEKLKQLGVRIY